MKDQQHLDPARYPKLINPIERGMKRGFVITTKKIVIDITKQLTTEIKQNR